MKKTILTIFLGLTITILVLGSVIGGMYLFSKHDKKEASTKDTTQEATPVTETKPDTNTETDTKTKANNKVTMYIFHGAECPTCIKTLDYLKTILDDYDYLDIELFELWHSSTNPEFLQEVEKELNLEIGYVPFIFIGADYHTYGFNEEKLLSAITSAHEDPNYKDIIKPILAKTKVQVEQKTLKNN